MPNPFRKDAPVVRPSGVSQREWARLGILATIFFVLLGSMVVLYFLSKKRRPAVEEVPKKVERTEPVRVTPPPAQDVEAKAMATLQTLRDGPEKMRSDGPELLDFLYLMLHLTPEEVAKRVDPTLGPNQLRENPAAHRGKYVRLYGRLIDLSAEPIGVTTPTGTKDMYLGIMQTHPTDKTAWFYLPEMPLDPATGKPLQFHTKRIEGHEVIVDWVEVEGLFLRNYEYEGQAVGRPQGPRITAPVIFGRGVRLRTAPPARKPSLDSGYLIGGAAVVIIGLVIFAGILTRRYGNRSIRLKMHDVRRERAQAEGKELFPKADPLLGEQLPEEPGPTPPRES